VDLFAHVLAGGLVAEGLRRIRWPGRATASKVAVGLGLTGAFFAGALSHLALDRLPHFGFLPHVLVWSSIPHAWLVRPVVGGMLALAFVMHEARTRPWLPAAASLGAIYPDVEKIAHTELGVPWVLFRAHAEVTATYTGGYPPKVLAAFEIAAAIAMAVAYARLARAPVRSRGKTAL